MQSAKKDKIINLNISKFINNKFRDYALYVLTSRGIPAFEDALTPIQRYILDNTPLSYTKTLSVVGKCIESGYHHGNCLDYNTKINLADNTQITLGEWTTKYPEAKLLVKCIDEENKETISLGHSPRIGQETNEYLEIELENGEIIKCTKNHPFFVNGKWIKAEDLNEQDNLFTLDYFFKIIKSIKIIKTDLLTTFYDITVDKYHNFSISDSKIITHNSSLEKSISRLARPHGLAMQLIEGYGFFGTEVSPDPAAARYTSVKLSGAASAILRKYKYLFTKNEDGTNDPFWLDVPIGLTTPIVGIAVGYKSIILPRKLEDIKEFLLGNKKDIKPYFADFEGTIKLYNSENSWLISSKITVKDNRIEVRGLPPIIKYSSTLNRLDHLFSKFEMKIKLVNNSNTKVKLDIIYLGKDNIEFNYIKDYIQKIFSVIVNENPVFIKNNQVIVYKNVNQYLEDFKWQIIKLNYYDSEYNRNWVNTELEFNKIKKVFIEFILDKKRSVEEIDTFLQTYSSDFKSRLESLTAKKFTKDELKITINKINELTKELKVLNKLYKESKAKFESAVDPTLGKSFSSAKSNDLFDVSDLSEDNGIIVWDGSDDLNEVIKEDSLKTDE